MSVLIKDVSNKRAIKRGGTESKTIERWLQGLADGSLISVIATGSTTARSLPDRFADFLNVKDFGAVGNGVTNDASAFTAAIAAIGAGTHRNIIVPAGTYLLNSSPTIGGKTVAWLIMPGAMFTGAGSLPGMRIFLGNPPTSTGLYDFAIDTSDPDGAGGVHIKSAIPSTVDMAGGANVQDVGFVFDWRTSAQTPNSGLAETDCVRLIGAVNSDAGSKVQFNFFNGLLTVAHDENSSGTEHGCLLFTSRATGPIGSGTAAGIWGADLHVEKSATVRDGKMIALELGVHKAPALGSAKCRALDIWSGDRSGITATRAGHAIRVGGNAGWTTVFEAFDTDDASSIFKVDQNGNITSTPLTGSAVLTIQPSANNTNASIVLVGRTSAPAQVGALFQASSGAEVTIGSTSAHDVVFYRNSAALARLGAAAFTPQTSDAMALGSTSLMWSDAYFASGAVINFNNGNVTLTHSAGATSWAAGSGNFTKTLTTGGTSTTANLVVSGRDSGGSQVNAILQAAAGGQITFGASTNHAVVMIHNNAEVWRTATGFVLKSVSGAETTGAGSALLGANSPASTLTAPYTWLKFQSSDGSTVYVPAWK